MHEFVAFSVLVGLSFIFAVGMIITSLICAPKSPNEIKNSTYECGMQIVGKARIKFNIEFLIFAIMFLIFDVETVMLIPFSIALEKVGLLVLIEVFIFVLLILIGLFYLYKKKVLRFK